MKLRLTLFLLVTIAAAALLSGVGVGIDARRTLERELAREIAQTQEQMGRKVQAFDLFLSNLERELDREMNDALLAIGAEVAAGAKPVEALSEAEMRALIARHALSDIYFIDADKVVINTTFPPDRGLDLGALGAGLDAQLEALRGSGRVMVDRISMSNQTGIIKKYAYLSLAGRDDFIEVSVDVREGMARRHSRAAQDFLFGVFFQSAGGGAVVEQELFIADELAQWSLLREGVRLDPAVAERLKETERFEEREGDRLTVYRRHAIADSHSDFYYISRAVYDVGGPAAFARRSLGQGLLILLVVVVGTFLVASPLFNRWFTARLGTILKGVARIEAGDYTRPIALSGRDDLARAAGAIDAMREGILQRETALRQARDELERRVAERTEELHRSLDALESRESAYRYLVENANSAILRWSPGGRVTFFNEYAQRFFGWPEEEIVGRNLRETIVPAYDRDGFDLHAMIGEIGTHPSRYAQNENENITRDGRRVWMRWANRAVFDERGEVVEVLSVGTDISDLKRAEEYLRGAKEAAEAASRAKSEFLATMSHEIRTPMNAVIGMADILRDSGLDEERASYVQVLRRNSETLLTLINDILDLSKVEAGAMELELVAFDLGELVCGVVEAYRHVAEDKGLELTGEVEPEAAGGWSGDVLRLRQVLTNLVGNALKFTERGAVKVVAGVEGEEGLRFSVVDSGIGIAEEAREAIFEPFTQADGSTTRRFGGTGLGLAISRRLVELMEGAIEVDSRVGEGSRFSVIVPMERSELPLPPPAGEIVGGGVPAVTRPLSLLLAEDAEDNILLIRAYLKETPHRLDVVHDGEQAFERFTEGEYDLVLMDVQMPGTDGYAATRRIRRWESEQGRERRPILALTANAMREDVRRTLDAGCDAHLAKPIKKGALLQALVNFTDRESQHPAAIAGDDNLI